MNQTIITEGVICPDCGQNTATIVLEERKVGNETGKAKETKSWVIFTHDLCGFRQTLQDYITTIIEKNFLVEKQARIFPEQELEITAVYADSIVNVSKAFKEIETHVGKYFKKITVYLQDVPDSTLCPLCGGSKYELKDNQLHCIKDHYSVRVYNFLKRLLIENNFLNSMTDNGSGEHRYHVYRQVREKPSFWDFILSNSPKPRTTSIAHFIYRHAILIVKTDNESESFYKELVDLLTSRLPGVKILEYEDIKQ